MQRLNGKWQVKTYRSETEIDTTLTAPAADVSAWESVTIPEKEGNGAWAAVYRTEFTMPFKWIDREIFVRLDAVSRAYYVYANGHLAGYHADSKTPAYFDITPYVADGKNTLAVIAYAHPVSTTLENQIKTPGTCIEGDVSVIAQPKVRIRDFVADTRFATDGNGLFSFGAIVKSHLLNPKEVIVYYELIAPDDSTVIAHGKRDARFHLRAEDTVRFFANLPDIQSWSHESPKLYTVALKLQHEGRFTEYTKVKLGFRDVSFDEKRAEDQRTSGRAPRRRLRLSPRCECLAQGLRRIQKEGHQLRPGQKLPAKRPVLRTGRQLRPVYLQPGEHRRPSERQLARNGRHAGQRSAVGKRLCRPRNEYVLHIAEPSVGAAVLARRTGRARLQHVRSLPPAESGRKETPGDLRRSRRGVEQRPGGRQTRRTQRVGRPLHGLFSLRPSLSTKNSRRWARPRSRPERLRAKWRSATAVRSPT